MKIAIVLGTRPEIIKMSPLIRACQAKKIGFFILDTGQHYSYGLSGKFFQELDLPPANYNLGVGSLPYRQQVGLMVKGIKKILLKEKPDVVLVQGDTNSVLAGALAAKQVGIRLAHHEAGLRSNDLGMLEEINRIITDQLSDFLFAPTSQALKNLREEGISKEKIFLSGNTVVDAVHQNLKISQQKVDVFKKLNIKKKQYIVVTAHRAENVDDKKKLSDIIRGLSLVARKLNLSVIYPIHPRTRKNLKQFGLKSFSGSRLIPPLGYLEFLQLESRAALIITDSGGLQEEACILKIPCVTIRENTERPETIQAKVNILVGTNPERILAGAKKMLKQKINRWVNPFGQGDAAPKILNQLTKI